MNETTGPAGPSPKALGIVSIILGILSMVMPGLTGFSIVLMIGFFVLAAGGLRMFWAFRAASFGKGLLVFAIGILTALCGVALIAKPLFGAEVLTIMLALYLVIDGASEIAVGVDVRPRPGSGWMIVGGILSIALSFMIWMQAPLSGVWAIGILMGVKMFMVGMMMVSAAPPAEGQAA